MPEFDRKLGSGVLLSKDKAGEKSPDYKGELRLDQDYKAGDVIKLSAWQRQSNRGPLISLAVDNWKPSPDWKPSEQRTGFVGRAGHRVMDDDVPF